MPNSENDRKEDIEELIAIGSDIAGGAAGGAIGFFTAGSVGAVLGGITGPLLSFTFRRLANEIKHRLLGKREEVRIGATIAFAAKKIQENIANGLQVRQDGFFQRQHTERAAAEEILEGVLLAAQREHQEKKLLFYGNLVANIAFHPEIDRAEANLLIRLGEQVSYRQMCLLALFMRLDTSNLRQEDYRSNGNVGTARVALLQEIYALYLQGMLNASGVALLSLADIKPSKIKIQGTGTTLYELMELWKVDMQDIVGIIELLR
ncbi:hypothetical protein DOJK_00162 [Patescibacteria group bacterium]|nr:hypothetical protein DOJK_00162 [Patescibacteria group bacterium]